MAATVLAVVVAPALHAANFASGTRYTTRVLSVAPLVLEYTLAATSAPAPADFAAMELEGPATLVYAWKRDEAFLYASTVDIDATGNYGWHYPSFIDTTPGAALSGVDGGEASTPVVLPFMASGAASYSMKTRFVVRFAPGIDAVDPADVHLQIVHFSVAGAPYIDVYRYAP